MSKKFINLETKQKFRDFDMTSDHEMCFHLNRRSTYCLPFM